MLIIMYCTLLVPFPAKGMMVTAYSKDNYLNNCMF